MKDHSNPIVRLSFNFSIKIVSYTQILEEGRRYVIARQLLASGTSIGANIMESQSAESKKDFIHKLKISFKELLETRYWLEICKYSKGFPDPTDLITEIEVIRKVLNAIIATTIKSNQKKTTKKLTPKTYQPRT
ncbi:MAG TPA: four helix bundle protein [Bacteroidia bacterium]|nr:four helix bundle protein [Bacteroidia bacterium]